MSAVIAARRTTSFHPQSSTANASALESQATAPVLEFRCTYTREGHKKAPKFHDGTVTYHAFNRVVMLYDDTRRVVANHHCRGDEEVEDGVRLTFDRSVLVDVAEPAGETQTDLNHVLLQRSPGRRPVPALRTGRNSTPTTLGRPRSLRDVLGATQGPIGRARFPSQTPYKQRHPESVHPDQPPAKRVRIATGKENQPFAGSSKAVYVPQQPRDPSASTRTPSIPRMDAALASNDVLELSSDEEAVQQPEPSTRNQNPAPRLPQPVVPNHSTKEVRRSRLEAPGGDVVQPSEHASTKQKSAPELQKEAPEARRKSREWAESSEEEAAEPPMKTGLSKKQSAPARQQTTHRAGGNYREAAQSSDEHVVGSSKPVVFKQKSTSDPQQPAPQSRTIKGKEKQPTRNLDKQPAELRPRLHFSSRDPGTASSVGVLSRPAIASFTGSNATPRVYMSRPGTSQLQLSKEKPRRKLMYRALLPNDKLTTDDTPQETRTKSHPASLLSSSAAFDTPIFDQRTILGRRSPRLSDAAVHGAKEAEQADEVAPCEDPQVPKEDESRPPPANEPINITSSPLFVPQDDPPSSPSERPEESQDFEVARLPNTEPLSPGASRDFPISLSPKQSSRTIKGPFLEDDSDADDDYNSVPPRSAAKPTSQQLMPPPTRLPPNPQPTTPLKPQKTPSRPFRRVLSENDALLYPPPSPQLTTTSPLKTQREPFPSLLPDADFPPTAALLRHRSPIRPSNMPPPAALRRTLSDPLLAPPIDSRTATKQHITSFNVDPVAEEPSGEGETGPWTVDEAWLLFDVRGWPDGKKELVPTWAKGKKSGNSGAGVGGMGTGISTGTGGSISGTAKGFSSARGLWYEHTAQGTGVLRDEVGAL